MGMTRSEVLAVVKNIKSTTNSLDEQEKKMAVGLYVSGFPVSDIAAYLGVDRYLVYPFLKPYRAIHGALMKEAFEHYAAGYLTDIFEAMEHN